MEDYRVELYTEKGQRLMNLKESLWIKRKEEKVLSEYYNKKIVLKE